MSSSSFETHDTPGNIAAAKINDYLRKVAPNSIIDLGTQLAKNGSVYEASRNGRIILGAVKEVESNHLSERDQSFSVSLEILSPSELNATCSCSSDEEMQEQWCPHAVALTLNALELDLFAERGGFPTKESTYRIIASTPELVAETLEELVRSPDTELILPAAEPVNVEIFLDTLSDRFGIQIKFNGIIQSPSFFEEPSSKSNRSLDRILLQIVESKGSWDDTHKQWYVNSSTDIDIILNLIKEYTAVYDYFSHQPIRVVDNAEIGARLILNWIPSGVEISMLWLLPDAAAAEGKKTAEKQTIERTTDVFGTGPYWTNISGSIYRLSNNAIRIVGLFPNPRTVRFTRTDTAPILEFITQISEPDNKADSSRITDSIEVKNQQLAPKAMVIPPVPQLKLSLKSNLTEHFSSGQSIEISGALNFQYPESDDDQNIVYLPDRGKERDCKDLLSTLGFEYSSEKKLYQLEGDSALDLIASEDSVFPADWETQGLTLLKKNIKLSRLNFNLSLSGSESDADQQKPPAKGAKKQSEKSVPKTADWFECNITLDQNNSHVPLSTIFKNLKGEDTRWIKLENGTYAKIPGESLALLRTTLGMIDSSYQHANSIKTRISKAQALSLISSTNSIFSTSSDKALQSLKLKLDRFEGIKTIKSSPKFEGKLRNYQVDGISWINFLHDFEFGGILADEMGLGKTIQALAFIQALKESKSKEKSAIYPTLIVCPTSVLVNWSQEAKKFTPNLKVLPLHGPARKEHFSRLHEYDLVITSYALIRIDWTELKDRDFGYIILDEAQNIKNPQAATTKAVKTLRAQRRIILTGTPTENRPLELWSLMDFLMPGYLGNMEFFKNFIEKPIIEGRENNGKLIGFLNNKVRPFVLRRTKAQVEKDLPPKIESSMYAEMSQSQKELYLQILSEVKPQVFDEVAKKGVRGATVSILTALLRLRQVCNHPNSISGLKNVRGYDSGKFGLLKELVSESLDSGGKILVFSQFREMLRIIREWLEEEKIEHLYLDGNTKERQPLVDRFNNDSSIKLFLISLKAGGTGLNLTGADNVIIYDPWWNPAVENQAVDRAHRIGQKKTVNVYRLVTAETVEEKIMQLKDRKSKIVSAIMDGDGVSTLKLSKGDLEMLFETPPL